MCDAVVSTPRTRYIAVIGILLRYTPIATAHTMSGRRTEVNIDCCGVN